MKYGAIVLVQYIVCGLYSVPALDDKSVRERRFIAETEGEVKAGIRQLYADICEEYPLEEFPNRQFHICGVFREIACDMTGIIAEGESE